MLKTKENKNALLEKKPEPTETTQQEQTQTATPAQTPPPKVRRIPPGRIIKAAIDVALPLGLVAGGTYLALDSMKRSGAGKWRVNLRKLDEDLRRSQEELEDFVRRATGDPGWTAEEPNTGRRQNTWGRQGAGRSSGSQGVPGFRKLAERGPVTTKEVRKFGWREILKNDRQIKNPRTLGQAHRIALEEIVGDKEIARRLRALRGDFGLKDVALIQRDYFQNLRREKGRKVVKHLLPLTEIYGGVDSLRGKVLETKSGGKYWFIVPTFTSTTDGVDKYGNKVVSAFKPEVDTDLLEKRFEKFKELMKSIPEFDNLSINERSSPLKLSDARKEEIRRILREAMELRKGIMKKVRQI